MPPKNNKTVGDNSGTNVKAKVLLVMIRLLELKAVVGIKIHIL